MSCTDTFVRIVSTKTLEVFDPKLFVRTAFLDLKRTAGVSVIGMIALRPEPVSQVPRGTILILKVGDGLRDTSHIPRLPISRLSRSGRPIFAVRMEPKLLEPDGAWQCGDELTDMPVCP